MAIMRGGSIKVALCLPSHNTHQQPLVVPAGTAAMWTGPELHMQMDLNQTQVLLHAVLAHRLWRLSS